MKIRFCKKCDGQENLSKPGYSDVKCQNCGSEEFYIKEVEEDKDELQRYNGTSN